MSATTPNATTLPWRVIVPIKPPGQRKTRLAAALDPEARAALAQDMFRHVMAVLAQVPEAAPLVLSPRCPAGWSGAWLPDRLPVNAMLGLLRRAEPQRGFAVVNADLPLLRREDIHRLISAASDAGIALAPDGAGTGTNAVALAPGHGIAFHFGPASFAAFLAEAGARARTVRTPGLATDIDRPEDLAALAAASAA